MQVQKNKTECQRKPEEMRIFSWTRRAHEKIDCIMFRNRKSQLREQKSQWISSQWSFSSELPFHGPPVVFVVCFLFVVVMIAADKCVRIEDTFCYTLQKSFFRKHINCNYWTSYWTKSLRQHPSVQLNLNCFSWEVEKKFWWMRWDEVFCVGRSFISGSFIFQGIWTHFLLYFARNLVNSLENFSTLTRRHNGGNFNQIGFWVRSWLAAFITSNMWRNFVDVN